MVERSLSIRVTGIDAPYFQNESHFFNDNHYLQKIYCILKFLTIKFSANKKKIFIVADEANKTSVRYLSIGDVAQMAERSLSMREVRGSMPRISKILVTP